MILYRYIWLFPPAAPLLVSVVVLRSSNLHKKRVFCIENEEKQTKRIHKIISGLSRNPGSDPSAWEQGPDPDP